MLYRRSLKSKPWQLYKTQLFLNVWEFINSKHFFKVVYEQNALSDVNSHKLIFLRVASHMSPVNWDIIVRTIIECKQLFIKKNVSN